ncbi:MAG: aconitase X catalytic domain-containing protein [Thermodesulfobacteriota bacterium]
MELTVQEKEMMDGKYGEGAALAMKIQVAIGETFDAEKMVDITRAHVALSAQDADLWFVEKLLNKGAFCKVSPTVNPSINLKYLNAHLWEIPKAGLDIVNATNEAYRKIGATLTFNCTPYLIHNVPSFGEIVAFSESSATPYVNSVLGARSNRESSQSALCAAVTGKVPVYGLLLDENRKAEILVQVEADIKDDFDYQLLGWCYPEMYKGLEVPVFSGIKKRPTPEGYMNFGAQLNTSGAISMYHIAGFTPEAPTLEAALGGNSPKLTITITQKDIDAVRQRLCGEPGKIDFAMFGCPHFTISQIKTVASQLEGKKTTVPIWVLTSQSTRELAARMGYLDIIQRAGGHLLSDTCIDVPPCWHPYYGKTGVTDSPKCSYYYEIRKTNFIIRPLEQSIEAAIRGEVVA